VPVGNIEIDHLREAHLGIRLPLQQGTEWGSDVGRGEPAGGDLVKQRLKQVEVSPVDQSHLDRCPSQGTNCEQPAKAASYNDNAVLHFNEQSPFERALATDGRLGHAAHE
jgi:hypothetical protein